MKHVCVGHGIFFDNMFRGLKQGGIYIYVFMYAHILICIVLIFTQDVDRGLDFIFGVNIGTKIPHEGF